MREEFVNKSDNNNQQNNEFLKVQVIYDVFFALFVFGMNYVDYDCRSNLMLLIGLPIFYNGLLTTWFLDMSKTPLLDPSDNYIRYIIRFMTLYIIIGLLSIEKLMMIKTLVLLISLILTRNDTIKDEYIRLISLVFYLFFLNNIIAYDFYLTIYMLYWYYFIFKYKEKIVPWFLPNLWIINLLNIYTQYFMRKKAWFFGSIFNILLFSIPFFFFYLFDARIIGILVMNIILTTFLLARCCYIKIVKDPEFSFRLVKSVIISDAEKVFTAIATLIEFEIEELQEKIKVDKKDWMVYFIYEQYRLGLKKMIEFDIEKIELEFSSYKQPGQLISILTNYYERVELPFDNEIFLLNEMKLSGYRTFEKAELFDGFDNSGIELALMKNNIIEVRTKNPLFFLGFFSEEKFFLTKVKND